MMKRYTITVNGIPYDVTVDEAGAGNGVMPVSTPAPAPAAAPAAPAAPSMPLAVENEAPKPAGTAGSVKVDAPMPGTILDIKVSVGNSVNSGDTLCVLEAMKMENEIVAPQAGTVASVNVGKGDSVEAGQVLITLN